MRRLDDTPLDPEIAASLDAIDATLAGDPVDPEYAELAELALLLTAERPQPTAAFAGALDDRVKQRFPSVRAQPSRRRRLARWWLWTPAAGFATALVVAIVIVVGGGQQPVTRNGAVASSVAATPAAAGSAHAASGSAPATKSPAITHSGSLAQGVPARTSSAQALSSDQAFASPANGSPGTVLQPPSNGRKVIQGAELYLTAAANRIDDVAQELFDVVGQVHGIVKSSNVTATGGPGGYAQFQLSIPSGSLSQAMAALSTLHYARVVSRTDTTQDVNNQYQSDVQQLADARARRAALLQQLANAATQGQIDSLTVKLHDTEAEISSDQATLQSLNNQIAYSQVTVTINGGPQPVPVPVQSGGGGFTLHKAVHDAGRVLTVAAGVALVGLAALVPFAMLGALAWWIASAVRRRRRDQALDLV